MTCRTVDLLKKHNINPSSQRVRIYDYLTASREHPTVDAMYEDLQREGHLFSRATVYNTVNLFLQRGLIRSVKVDTHEMRYDVVSEFHAHFKCESCGAIVDLPMPEPLPLDTRGLLLRQTSLTYSGLCRDCRKDQADF